MIAILKALCIMLFSLPNQYTNIIMNVLQALSILLLKYMHHKSILCIVGSIFTKNNQYLCHLEVHEWTLISEHEI